jgi:hypothetical protein
MIHIYTDGACEPNPGFEGVTLMSDIPADVMEAAQKVCGELWSMDPKLIDEDSIGVILLCRAVITERERCASIIENFASGRSITGEAVKVRKVPSQTSILMAQLIRGGN